MGGIFWSKPVDEDNDAQHDVPNREASPSISGGPGHAHSGSAGGHMEWQPDQQAVWVSDKAVNHCMLCKTRFSFLFRRHHCRLVDACNTRCMQSPRQCGSLVCQECSPHRALARGFITPQRICSGCMGALVIAEQSAAQSRRASVDHSHQPSAGSSVASSAVGSRRTSPSRLVADRHAQHKADEAARIAQQADAAPPVIAAPVPVHAAPTPALLLHHHHTSSSSTTATASLQDSGLPPHHSAVRHSVRPASPTPATTTSTAHSSTLSLSVPNSTASTIIESPSSANAAANAGLIPSPRTGVRRMSLSREGSPSHSPVRRKSISGQPAFQPHTASPQPETTATAAAASAAAASSVGEAPKILVESLPAIVLFNRLAGFGSLLVLDIRSAEEYRASHVPRALNIPLTDGDLLPASSEASQGELAPSECTAMLSALESRLHMTDQRAFRMRQRCTIVLVGQPAPADVPADASAPAPYSITPFLTSAHHPHALHLARLLQVEGKIAAVSIVAGGFAAFQRGYPFVCCAYTPLECKSGKHIHRKPFPWYPNEILGSSANPSAAEAAASSSSAPAPLHTGAVYLGSKVDASNLEHLRHLGVTHILNCTSEIPCHFENELNSSGAREFTYMRIELHDEVNVPIAEHFAEAFAFLDSARASGGRTLVHCQEGISRSSTILIAFLMARAGLSLKDAYGWTKNARKQVFPNLGFWRQLSTYELTLKRERLVEEARARGEDESTVPALTELTGTMHECIDMDLLTAEYRARKAAADADAGVASTSSDSAASPTEMTASQRVHRAVFSPNSSTLQAVRGVASEDARDRAQEAIVEEAQTPAGPIVTSE